MPIIDLLELWSEAFEMKQEKSALYGEPHSQPNPYTPPHNSPDSQYHGDQTDPAGCLDEVQERARASLAPEPIDNLEAPFLRPKGS